MSSKKVISMVLSFWFGEQSSPNYGEQKSFWFQSTPEWDRKIQHQFEIVYHDAMLGKLDDLSETPEGALALILILDQFPRNMYRGTPLAFASDQKALEIAKNGLIKKFDQSLMPVERSFFYLPFEHSENLGDQEKSVMLYQTLGDKEYLEYAKEHHDVIARFGRFPHRNAILGRTSSQDEINYLAVH
ncbi:MAG: DUF924 domain-containing protein [Proteobacteria bacterium]|nr:DUF924 domain-containing protein [Pseudomonadota bacterium]